MAAVNATYRRKRICSYITVQFVSLRKDTAAPCDLLFTRRPFSAAPSPSSSDSFRTRYNSESIFDRATSPIRIAQNVSRDGFQPDFPRLIVEREYASDLRQAIAIDGLTVREALVEDAAVVVLGAESFPIRRTPKRHLREVD